jgi:hypothetical protein
MSKCNLRVNASASAQAPHLLVVQHLKHAPRDLNGAGVLRYARKILANGRLSNLDVFPRNAKKLMQRIFVNKREWLLR